MFVPSRRGIRRGKYDGRTMVKPQSLFGKNFRKTGLNWSFITGAWNWELGTGGQARTRTKSCIVNAIITLQSSSHVNVEKSVLCDIESMEKRRVLIHRFGNSLGLVTGIFRFCVTSIYYNASLLRTCCCFAGWWVLMRMSGWLPRGRVWIGGGRFR